MAFGPGKYDDILTEVRERTEAAGAMLIIFGGNRGEGFSAQLPATLTLAIPELLENIARQIRADMSRPV